MGMCIRVHGIFSSSTRAVLVGAALLLLTAFPAMAQDLAEAETAVAPHWSPYTAPTDFAPEDQVYIIVRGDNLWNLANRFYSDPLLWPQIWDANRYILDAHWIYPGDPLVIPEAPDVAAQRMVEGEDEFGEEPMPGEAVADLGGEPVPPEELVDPEGAGDGLALPAGSPGTLVSPVDVYCAPMILPDLDPFEWIISGAEEGEKVGQSLGDVVYLDGGADDGITAGDRFFVLRNAGKVQHPESGRNLGLAIRQVGELEVLCTSEHDATAVISKACADIAVGDLISPWEELPIPVVDPTAPLSRCDEPAGESDGYLVYAMDDQWAVAEGNLVVIDKGSDDGLGPGDFFTIYRNQDSHQQLLGEAVVLRTERSTATVKITTSLREIYAGDRVALK